MMTVEEAQEVLNRLGDVPEGELTDAEAEELHEAIEVLDATNAAGEILRGAASAVVEARQGDEVEPGNHPLIQSSEAVTSGVRAIKNALGDLLKDGVSDEELIESVEGLVGGGGLADTPGTAPHHLMRIEAAKRKLAARERRKSQERVRSRKSERDPGDPVPGALDRQIESGGMSKARQRGTGGFGLQVDPQEAQLLRGQGGGLAAGRPQAQGDPIGVDPGFIAERETVSSAGTFGGPDRHIGRTQDGPIPAKRVEPRYNEGDQFKPAGMRPEKVIELQRRMVDAGLLEADSYHAGYWDSNSVRAYQEVLGMANAAGTTDEAMLNNLRSAQSQQQDDAVQQRIASIKARSFMAPDYASLSQDVKTHAEQLLQRELDDYEVQLLANQMKQDYRAQFEAEQKAAIAEAEAVGRAREEGTGEGVVEGTTVQQVDPVARFKERFEDRYSSELDRRENVEDIQENFGLVMQSLRGMDQMVGS